MRDITQNTAKSIFFLMIDANDHLTGKTGLSPTVKLSKNGAAGAAPAGAVSEVDATNLPGWYKLAATAADTGTLGALLLHASATGADPIDQEWQIVAYDPGDAAALGLSRLDAAVSSRAATGAAMTLTAGERTAVANEVETQIIDETDSEKVLTAITDKIASVNPSLSGLTLAAIASAVRDVLNTSPAANSLGAAVKAIADRAPGSGTLATTTDVPTALQNADALLGRNQQGGSNNTPHVSDALAGGLMKFTINVGTGVLSVLNGDGTTAYTRTLSRSALDAIVGST